MQGNQTADELLVGLDVGTTNIKAIAFTASGHEVARASIATPTHYPQPGWAYHEPEELWQHTLEALRQVTRQLDDPRRVVGLAIASLGETAIPLDAHDSPTYYAIAWHDFRTVPQAQWLDEVVGRDALYQVTGVPLTYIYGLCKLLWLRQHQPEAYARTEKWLNVADYLAYRMSGVVATDYSLASRMMTLDIGRLRWADDLLRSLDISSELFAPLRHSGTDLGPLLQEVAVTTGLPTSPRVAVGGHDHVCGALAAGVTEPGTILNSMGTSEVVFLPIDRPLSDLQIGRQGYDNGVHVDGRHFYVYGSMRTSGACVDWFRNLFAKEIGYAALIEEAEQISPGSRGVCFLPHLRSAVTPNPDPKALGAFVGLRADAGRGVLFRAVLEGVAYETRNALEPLLRYLEITQNGIVAIGGGSQNSLFMQIKASVLRQTIHVFDMKEAVALGAAMLGGLGAGVYQDIATATEQIQFRKTQIEPVPEEVQVYDMVFSRVYQEIYPALRPANHEIHAILEEIE